MQPVRNKCIAQQQHILKTYLLFASFVTNVFSSNVTSTNANTNIKLEVRSLKLLHNAMHLYLHTAFSVYNILWQSVQWAWPSLTCVVHLSGYQHPVAICLYFLVASASSLRIILTSLLYLFRSSCIHWLAPRLFVLHGNLVLTLQ